MKARRRSFNAEVPSMAMGDIAFLLLIFIVIMATAKKPPDSHVVAEPPEAEKPDDTKPAVAWVAVDIEQQTFLNGKPVDAEILGDRLTAMLAEIPYEDRVVEIKIHRSTTAEFHEPVLEAVSGVARPKIIIREPKEK